MENIPEIKNENTKEKEYFNGVNIIKIVAMLFVIFGHAILFNNGFNLQSENSNFANTLISIFFNLFACAVSLFLIISGYLSINKKPTKSYFLKLFVYLIEYVLCCIFAWIIKILVFKQSITFAEGIISIFTFNMISYSWYINMFIGLYLLSPYLNILYKALENKKAKLTLIFILFLIIMVPSSFENLGWNYWITAFPLLFYFVGLYIREYQPKIKKIWLITIIVAYSLFEVVILELHDILSVRLMTNSSIFYLIVSTSIFLLFYDCKKPTGAIGFAVKNISKLSLSTFLVSYVFDNIFNNYFCSLGIFSFRNRLPYLLFITPLTVILSLVTAYLISLLTKLIVYLYKIITDKIKNKKIEKIC